MHAYLSSLKLMICGPYHKDSFYIKISKNPSRVGGGGLLKATIIGVRPCCGLFLLFYFLFVMLLVCFLVSKFTIVHLFS